MHFGITPLGERVELADSAKLYDEHGQVVELRMSRSVANETTAASLIWSSDSLALKEARSEVVSTSGGSYTCTLSYSCTLRKAGVEVPRIPVQLGGTGVTVVRP